MSIKLCFSFVTILFVFTTHSCVERKSFSEEKLLSAQKYLQSLEDRKDSWVDPYDMLNDGIHLKHSENEILEPSKKKSISKQTHLPVDSEESVEKHAKLNEAIVKPIDINNKESARKNTADSSSVPDGVQTEKPINEKLKCKEEFSNTFDIPSDKRASPDLVFLSRWLKKIINRLEEQAQPNSEWEKIVNFPITHYHYQRLNSILKQKTPNMVDVESIFSDFLTNMTLKDKTAAWVTFSDEDIFVIMELALMIISSILAAVLLGIMFYKRPIFTVIFVIVVVSVVFQCMQMYSLALAKRASQLERINFHNSCKQSDFSLLSSAHFYIKSFFISSDSCHDYYKAIMVNPLTEVSLLKAISLTFSNFIFAPLEAFAQTCNIVMKELLADLSYTAISFLGFFTFVILAMFFNYRLRLPFFTALEPCAPVRVSIEQSSPDVISKRKISALVSEEVKQIMFKESKPIQLRKDSYENNETKLCQKFKESLCLNEDNGSSERVKSPENIDLHIQYLNMPMENSNQIECEDVEQSDVLSDHVVVTDTLNTSGTSTVNQKSSSDCTVSDPENNAISQELKDSNSSLIN